MKILLFTLNLLWLIHYNSAAFRTELDEIADPTDPKIMKYYFDKHAAQVVYTGIYISRPIFLTVGVIISANIIITNFAQIPRANGYAFVVAGQRKITKDVKQFIRYFRAANLHEDLHSRRENEVQIGVIKLDEELPLVDTIKKTLLPTRTYLVGEACVTINWEKPFTNNLQFRKIKIEPFCPGTPNNRSDKVFCFNTYNKQNKTNSCRDYAGGEPIFCSDQFLGIVNHYHYNECHSDMPRYATSVADNLEWIQQTIDQLLHIDYEKLSNATKLKSFHIFYIILLRYCLF